MANEKLLDVEIVTPGKTVFIGKAQSVTVPGTLAPFQILFNHAAIVSSLDPGTIRIFDDEGKNVFFATGKGFAEVNKNLVSILVESAQEDTVKG